MPRFPVTTRRKGGDASRRWVCLWLPLAAAVLAAPWKAAAADAAYHVTSTLDSVVWQRTSAVKSVPAKRWFMAQASLTLTRLDDTDQPVHDDNIAVQLNWQLRDAATAAVVPLKSTQLPLSLPVPSYALPQVGPPKPSLVTWSGAFAIEPTDGTQLDSVTKTYQLVVSVAHVDQAGGQPLPGNSLSLGGQRLLHFNGSLWFGAIESSFTSLAIDPPFVGAIANGVRSSLSINNQSGFILNHPNHVFGDGAALSVILRANGNAEYAGVPAVSVTAPIPDGEVIERVRFQRALMTLDATGAKAAVTVFLPAGFGYRENLNGRILRSTATFPSVPLDAALRPAADPRLTGTLYAVEESKPLWLLANSLEWRVQKGEFFLDSPGVRYVRRDELDALAAAPGLVDPAMRSKRSNEQYFRYAVGSGGPGFVVTANEQGHAVLTGECAVAPGTFATHFPYDTTVTWAGTGRLVVSNDLVLPNLSSLPQVTTIGVKYQRDCFEPGCLPGAGAVEIPLLPANGELHLTLDGGLHAEGELFPGRALTWGWIGAPVSDYAHRTDPFTAASVHVPGCFLRGDQFAPVTEQRPAAVLLTGVISSNLFHVERPGTPAYLAKNVGGDYAGLNCVTVTDSAHSGQSVLAARPTGPYALTARCKYYVRWWGVSGIHEAVPGTFAPAAELYNYHFNISQLGLSFLGSQNVQSRTEGNIVLPWPAGFGQNFKELTFLCNGALDQAKVPADEADLMKLFQYWNGDFVTQGIHFAHNPNLDCDPSKGFLVLGVKAFLSNVGEPLFGELGVQTNGNFLSLFDALQAGVDVRSRLLPANNVSFNGYNLVPVTDAYYNNFDFHPSGSTALGFLNLAGSLDVPFFENLRIHAQAQGKAGVVDSLTYVMGGWTKADTGWKSAGHHFFNYPNFDTAHIGFDPAAGGLSQYRKQDDDGSETYLARAEKKWLGVVDFDFPLHWDPLLHVFRSGDLPVTDELLVLETSSQVDGLDPKVAYLRFGLKFDGVPAVNLASLALNDLAGGVFTGGVLDSLNVVKSGLDGLDRLLNDDAHDLFSAPFDALFAPTIDALVDELVLNFDPVTHTWPPPKTSGEIIKRYCHPTANNYAGNIEARVENMLGTVGSGALLTSFDSTLAQAELALEEFGGLLARGAGGDRPGVAALISQAAPESLAGQQAALAAAVQGADATFGVLSNAVGPLQKSLDALRDALAPGGNWASELSSVVGSYKASGTVAQLAGQIENDLNQMVLGLEPIVGGAAAALGADPFKKQVRQAIENRFHSTGLPAALQASLRQRLYDQDHQLRAALDSMFSTGNAIVRDLLAVVLAQVSKNYAPALGALANGLATARVDGYASIKGDSLKYLRLDEDARFDFGSTIEFAGALEIRELDSTGSNLNCGPGTGSWSEVKLSSDFASMGWLSPDLKAQVLGKFSFDNATKSVVNLMGMFDVQGGVNFEAFKLKEVGLAFGMGADDRFGAGKLRAEFNKKEMAAGLFIGKTCSPEPLTMVDPLFASALGNLNAFTGVYAYAEGWYPLNELLGIPSSCFLNLRGGAGIGVFLNVENAPLYGGKYHYGVSGEVLCLLEVQGEVDLIGLKQGDDYTFKGTGTLSGEIGECPFCVDFSKSIGLTCHVHLDVSPDGISDTDVDWEVDF